MDNVRQFLAYAIRLEQEAALRFDELADASISYGKKEVSDAFGTGHGPWQLPRSADHLAQ